MKILWRIAIAGIVLFIAASIVFYWQPLWVNDQSTRFRLWRTLSRLNERHALFAWISLFGVAFTDLYVRLLAAGVIQDPRVVF